MKKQRILVCGATGFIGRNIAERLAAREDCTVVGTYFESKPYRHQKVYLVRADLTKKEDVDRLVIQGADMIIQCAAVTTGAKDVKERPYIHVTDNRVMNTLLLRSVFEHRVPRFLFVSCTVMYPPNFGRPVTENDVDYNDIYPAYLGGAWMKLAVEKECEFYSQLRDRRTNFTIMRHSNAFGPHDKYDLEHSHMMSATITKVVTNKTGVLPVWGDGTETRDLLYIDDVVDFVERVVETPEPSPFEIYNVGRGQGYPVSEIVEKVIAGSGKDLRIEYDTAAPQIKMSVTIDCSKAKRVFGWEPKVSLEEGIRRTMEWYRKDLVPSI